MKCRERSCIFLAAPGESLCRYHLRVTLFDGISQRSPLADAAHFGYAVGRVKLEPRDGEAHSLGEQDLKLSA